MCHPVAAALTRKAENHFPAHRRPGDETVIADRYDVALSDNAVCHRNLDLGDSSACLFHAADGRQVFRGI